MIELRLFSPATMRLIEAQAIAAVPAGTLVQRAGGKVAQRIGVWLQERAEPADGLPTLVLCLVGTGHNGADALIAARAMHEAGLRVQVLLSAAYFLDLKQLPEACQQAYTRLPQEVKRHKHWPISGEGHIGVIVDGLLGIGSSRSPELPMSDWIARANAAQALRVAIDVPTGVDPATGCLFGSVAFKADKTVCLLGTCMGLLTADGPGHAGQIVVEPLGAHVEGDGDARVLDPSEFAQVFEARLINSHKGTFGDVWVVGGATGMVGAALLAGRSAMLSGAGRVHVGLLENNQQVDPFNPELMLRDALAVINSSYADNAVIAVGPGLGQSQSALTILQNLWPTSQALVVDADALNLLSQIRGMGEKRNAATVLTPHPLEAARLLKCTVQQVQSNRFEAARQLSQRYSCWTVIKGKGSIVCSPTGQLWVNGTDSPSLATAGSGDVLTGCIAALLAQGYAEQHAVCAAVWLHGKAGVALAQQHGTHGITASEIALSMRTQRHLLTINRHETIYEQSVLHLSKTQH